MPASLSPLQSYYAARAGEYDRIYQKPERQQDLRLVERWLPRTLAGKTVLEIACGTGYWTQFIAPLASSVLAIDSATETLQIAAQRVPPGRVKFEIGDAYALPGDRGRFDAAFAGFWFSHVPMERQQDFLRGLNTVLDPGAKVVLLDNLHVEGSSTPISGEDAAGNTYQSRTLADGTTHRVLKNFPSEAQMHALADAGLGQSAVFTQWQYFWAFEYAVPGPAPLGR
jgi:ubiquinone/menaquinone biosynthesis C-methylase UbiE